MKYLDRIRSEAVSPCLWRDVLCELVGTFFLLAAHSVLGLPLGSSDPVPVIVPALGCGLVVFAIIEGTSEMSGGYINPTVTLSLAVTRVISPFRALLFVLAELIGGLGGAAIIYSVTPDKYKHQVAPVNLRDDVAIWQAFLCEFLQGALLMFVAISVFDGKNRTIRLPSFAIGAAVAVNIMMFDKYTGGAMNPCVVFSLAVVTGKWDNHWIYWAGPLTGGAVGASIYGYIMAVLTKNFRPEPEKTHLEKLRLLQDAISDLVAHPERGEYKQSKGLETGDEKKAPLISHNDI